MKREVLRMAVPSDAQELQCELSNVSSSSKVIWRVTELLKSSDVHC
jgi:hypothetical protein